MDELDQVPVTISPELQTEGLTLADAARALAYGGLRVVPMTTKPTAAKPNEPANKNPGGLLGKGWQNKTSRDPDKVTQWFTQPEPTNSTTFADIESAASSDFYRDIPFDSMVLGIHTGADLVVLDIDDWKHVPEKYRNALLDPAVPFQSSSSTDPNRGHYLFTPRPGYRYGAGSLKGDSTESSPGEVRHGNSIIVSAPSAHQKAAFGRRYQWQRTGTPPIMPEDLAEWAGRNPADKGSSWQEATWLGNDLLFDAATGPQVDAFIKKCTFSAYPQVTGLHLDWMADLSENSLHSAFLGPLVDLMKFAAFGVITGEEAARQAMEMFVDKRTDPSRGDLGGNVMDTAGATKEFADLLHWAIGKTLAQLHTDTEALQYECFEQVQKFYVHDAPVPARPDNVEEKPLKLPKTTTQSIFYDGDREGVRATHAAISAAMVKHLVDKVRYCTDTGTFYVYDAEKRLWKGGREMESAVKALIAHLLENVIQPTTEMTFAKAIHQATLEKNEREAERLTALVVGTTVTLSDFYSVGNDVWAESMTARDGIMKALLSESELHVTLAEFDNQPDRLAVNNGILDLSPLAVGALPVLLEDGPEHLITFRSSTDYEPTATAPNWNKLIESAFDDPAINPFLAVWFGLCIDGTKNFGKFLLAYGKSHSGKGMIFGLGSALVFGNPQTGQSLVGAVDKNLIVKTGMDMSAHRRRVIAELRGKAMAYMDESGDGGSVDTDQLKSYTGGMPQQAERKFENQTMVDVPPLVVSSNHEWRLGDVDAGTGNRVISLYFAYGHGAGAAPDKPDDPDLPDKLRAEASGILNWALWGYMMWVSGGRKLSIPASIQTATDEMNAGASEFGTYLDQALDYTGDLVDAVPFKDLWVGWDNQDHGYKVTNMSRGAAGLVSPRASRVMRKSIEEHLAGKAGVLVTDKKAKLQYVYGVKLSDLGTQYVSGVESWTERWAK